MKTTAILIAGLALAAPLPAAAANANNPYSNVDHRIDAGNNTGDAQVEQLNQAQLNGTGLPPPRVGAGQAARPVAGPPGYAATTYPAAGYPAAPVYAAPRYGYYPAPAYVVVPRPYYYARPPFYYYPY